jgi:cytochrome c oxidase subunit 2
LAGKVDMIPNRANFLWFKADKAGYFYGQCAEYCGESHAIMRFRVIALDQPEYDTWLAAQKEPARTVVAEQSTSTGATVQFANFTPTKGEAFAATHTFEANPFGEWQQRQHVQTTGEDTALIAEGRRIFQEKTCTNCHSTRGHDGVGINGPDLTHVGSRSTIAAGVLENTPDRLRAWLKDPEYFKPGSKMYYGLGGMAGYVKPDGKGGWQKNIELTDHDLDALVAYLQSLK